MTWQLKDDTRLLPTSPVESDNGEVGSPKWVGDFRANWRLPSDLTLFYGINVIGGTSNRAELEAAFDGPCIDSVNPNDGTGLPPRQDVVDQHSAPVPLRHAVTLAVPGQEVGSSGWCPALR